MSVSAPPPATTPTRPARSRTGEHGDRNLGAERLAQPGGQVLERQPAVPHDRRAARDPVGDRVVLVEAGEPEALGDEARGRDLRVHVERGVHVVEGAARLAEPLEALARKRGETLDVVLECDRMLGEEQRTRRQRGDDHIRGKDAGGRALDLVSAPHEKPVPAPLVGGLRELPPVRLGIDVLVGLRPVVVLDLGNPEVFVERRDDPVEPHPSLRSASPSDCRVVSTPS
jgi:hypothetical protein